MRNRILPYRNGSKSVSNLKQVLDIKSIKLNNSRYVPRWNDLIVNWGNCSSSAFALSGQCYMLNSPANCRLASNKLAAFYCMYESKVNIPPFTIEQEQARDWLGNGHTVFARTKLRGSAGVGIVQCRGSEELVRAPLYVRYIKKKYEFRIHVFHGEVIDRQRKMRSHRVPDNLVNWQVRNMDNGFVFGRNDVDVPSDVDIQAVQAVQALGLDFGAVDVVYNGAECRAYVLEVNTAPGLVNTTLENYGSKIQEFIHELDSLFKNIP